MTTARAAVLRAADQPYSIEDVTLRDLRPNEVLVRIVGVGKGEDVRLVDRLHEAEAEHRLGDARGKRRRRVEVAIGEAGDGIGRPAQHDDLAAGQRHRRLGIVDRHAALGLEALEELRSGREPVFEEEAFRVAEHQLHTFARIERRGIGAAKRVSCLGEMRRVR